MSALTFTLNDIITTAPTDASFRKALRFILQHEGVYFESVPDDPGGDTCCGVTQSDYNDFRKEHSKPTRTVAQITAAEVGQLYMEHYWSPVKASQMPYPVALAVVDGGVNCGTGTAVRWLQGVLGVTQDGKVGPATLASITAYVEKHGAEALSDAIDARRIQYYISIAASRPTLKKFLAGWLNRVSDLDAAT